FADDLAVAKKTGDGWSQWFGTRHVGRKLDQKSTEHRNQIESDGHGHGHGDLARESGHGVWPRDIADRQSQEEAGKGPESITRLDQAHHGVVGPANILCAGGENRITCRTVNRLPGSHQPQADTPEPKVDLRPADESEKKSYA